MMRLMAKRPHTDTTVPPIRADFDNIVKSLLRTPPPSEGDPSSRKGEAAKRKAPTMKKAAPRKRKRR